MDMKGFTLLELLVVMLLITIVFAITVPRLDSSLLQDPRKKTTRWIINSIEDLRAAAVEKQKTLVLVIDMDGNRMWPADADMDEEAQAAASDKAFVLPGGVKIVDVRFPHKERVSTGTVKISFYPGGYSDQAIINMEDNDEQHFACRIEPLLPKVKVVDEWLEF
jgi:prepilin-type N-terminal cleavage/methylation domain-containing protein